MAETSTDRISFVNLLLAPVNAIRDSIFSGEGNSRFGLPGDQVTVGGVLGYPTRFLWNLAVFFVTVWSISRPGKSFLAAIPVLLVVCGLAAIMIVGPWLLKIDQKRLSMYEQQKVRFRRDLNDLDSSRFCAQQLWDLRPDELDYKFEYGAMLGFDRFEQAYELMETMATVEKAGYVRAHNYLADAALDRESHFTLNDQDRLDFAKKHLDWGSNILDADFNPESAKSAVRLADLYITNGDFDSAIEVLERVVNRPLMYLPQLLAIPRVIRCYKETGRTDRLERAGDKIMNELLTMARRFPDEIIIWTTLVETQAQAGKEDEVFQTFELATKLTSPNAKKELERLRTLFYINLAFKVAGDSEESFTKRLGYLTNALNYDLRSGDVYALLLQVSIMARNDPEKHIWLQNSMLSNRFPFVVQVLYGLSEGLNGNVDECREIWRIASIKSPFTAMFINNLLTVLIASAESERENALPLLQTAIEMFPDQYYLYATRGDLYFYMKEYEKAEQDLKFASEKLPSYILAKLGLARLYQETDRAELAEQLRKEIAETQSEQQ